jgi:leucyl aminopeptidase (aminopeptidase T)
MNIAVDIQEYESTGMHNAMIPQEILAVAMTYDIVIAMTEYSASAPLKKTRESTKATTRVASLPGFEPRMENSVCKADYKRVQRYATVLKDMLNATIGAKITFSTSDSLYLDLRNRVAEAEAGDCTQPGQFINFPSGEAYKAPYEASPSEVGEFGPSKTEGIMPVSYEGELVKYYIQHNTIVDIRGIGEKADEMRMFFAANETRRNIAELGIGCNPEAIVTGNPLEDEKVSGLHIAYGTSTQLGGKVDSDLHIDIIYARGCPVEANKLTLINNKGLKTEIICNADLQYELLRRVNI